MKIDTVSKQIKRQNESGNLRNKVKTGCPIKKTPEQDKAIVNKAKNKLKTNDHIIKNVLNVSLKTIRRRLNDQGIQRYAPEVKEKLTKMHCYHRLYFAEEHYEPRFK